MKQLINLSWFKAFLLYITLSFSVQSQTVLNSEDFESGNFASTIWNDAGDNCRINSKNNLSGTYSILLRDNTNSSNTYTNNIDFTPYNSVTIEFDFKTRKFDSGEAFFIEFSNDGGSTWNRTPVLQYTNGTDFNNDTKYTNITATVNKSTHSFTDKSKLRFRCDASKEDERIFIDNIIITGNGITSNPDDEDCEYHNDTHYSLNNDNKTTGNISLNGKTNSIELTIKSYKASHDEGSLILKYNGSIVHTFEMDAISEKDNSEHTVTVNSTSEFDEIEVTHDSKNHEFKILKIFATLNDCDENSNGNSKDTDGDGIIDTVDVDDDNDGILDTVECGEVYCFENVINGSFEEPLVSTGTWKLFYEKDVPGWKTTATDKRIELWASGFLGAPASDGNQLAELNANQTAALYQELCISGGTKIQWSVKHRGRDGVDVAKVRIGADLASAAIVETMSDNNKAWGTYIGTYNIPEGQNTTFFIFEAVSTASGYNSVGNLMDDFTVTIIEEPKCSVDTDGDGLEDKIDIDSDNDGIPDNIEAQTTLGYILPSGTVNTSGAYPGLWDNYGAGLTPIDTDSDLAPDYTDLNSDNDIYNDVEENGISNASYTVDDDNDGLINPYETNGINDNHWDVNEAIEDPTDLSILPDSDSDLNSGGDLDYRDVFTVNYPTSAAIDFDGVDDYLQGNSILNGLGELTIMAWIKIDAKNSEVSNTTIVGEDTACRLYVKDGNKVMFSVKTSANISKNISGSTVNYNEWHHVTGVFSATNGKQAIYIDGELIATNTNNKQKRTVIKTTSDWTGNFEIGRLSSSIANRQYFNGEIDEVRVFNKALTDSQIQTMIYQEIEENSGNVKGAVIPKNIIDFNTKATIPWSSLLAYYPMTGITSNQVADYSQHSNVLITHNITKVQDQTAPMPYKTADGGVWDSQNAWQHGNVWDIENIPSTRDWSIIKIENDVTISNSISTYGLIIDSEKTLTVNGNNLVKNTGYFELNGTLDLMNDSQLIQTQTSDLVTSAEGKTLRRQEGTSSAYWYNYWSSPTGAKGVTTLVDNNASTNNPNNSPFVLNMLKDDAGFNSQFTSGYTGNGSISTYWLYTFINGQTYWDWKQISTSTNLNPGVGYTQKGTGVPAPEQQYIFEGKPNNGTILVNVTDVGGPGSVPSVSKTEYLLGNPYPSALDIHQFIDDNTGIIDGTLQLWQQWSGSSHHLNEYNGGYAQVNKLGSTRAYQFVGISGAHNGSQDGTLVPSRYLPIGQGFITEIIADGNVEFNNGQRVFILENDADGTYNNGSVFLKNIKGKSKTDSSTAKITEEDNPFKKIRLEFNSVSGPDTKRELLLGFSHLTSDAYDYGYDSECDESNNNDLNLNFNGQNMNMQAYGALTVDKVVPLNFKSSGSNSFEIKISNIENIEEDQEVYLRDHLTGEYFNLKSGEAYGFSSEQGKFNERFEIVFQSQQQSLSVEEANHEANFVYYLNKERKIYVKKLNASVTKMSLISMSGQTVMELQDIPDTVLNNGIDIPNVSTGGYIACFRTDSNQVLTKKIIVN